MKVVVIGCGPAGVVASLTVRKLSPKADITVVGKDPIFVRCSAPYVLAGTVKLKKCIEPDSMLNANRIKVVRDEVVDIDTDSVKLKSGNKSVGYDYLVIATGARPFLPHIEGIGLKGVFVIRTPQDVMSLKKHLRKTKNVCILGGGMIGVETAALLSKKHKITLVEMLPSILSASYDTEITRKVEGMLKKMGISLFLGKAVKRINGSDSAESIMMGNIDIKADAVLVTAGVRPETVIAKKAGIAVGRFGIITDRHMETSMKNVYAVGDCVQTTHMITRKPAGSGLATNAVLQAKVAAMRISGLKAAYDGALNASVTQIAELSLGTVGLTEMQAKKSKIRHKCGRSETTTKYAMQPGAKPLFTKLLFDSRNKIIGAQAMGSGGIVPGIINLISFAIQKGSTMDDLKGMDYSAHPELTPLPFADPIVMACEDVK